MHYQSLPLLPFFIFMAEETFKTKINDLLTDSTSFGKTALRLGKAKATIKVIDLTSGIITKAILSLVAMMALLLGSISLSFYLGTIFNSLAMGFVTVAIIFCSILILTIVFRKSVRLFFQNKLSAYFYDEEKEFL